MKRMLLPIGLIFSLSIILFIVFTSAHNENLTEKDALEIGEEKYLEFLWMVDGAFNSERLNGEFVVNGKILVEDNKEFTCIYKNKNSDSCVGNNFENAFHNLFAANITYNKVYSDGSIYTWIKYENGDYIFTNLKNCNVKRMNLEQEIKLIKMIDNELVFEVNDKGGTQKREFALIKENDSWKVSRAFYHNLCEITCAIS